MSTRCSLCHVPVIDGSRIVDLATGKPACGKCWKEKADTMRREVRAVTLAPMHLGGRA